MDYIAMIPEWVDDEVLDMINEGKVFVRRNQEGEQYLLVPKLIPIECLFEFETNFTPDE